MRLINDSEILVSEFNLLQFAFFRKLLRLNAITIQFFNNNQAVSNILFINDGQYNYDADDSDAYQIISVPKNAITFSGTSFNAIALRFGNNLQNIENTWFVDRILLKLGTETDVVTVQPYSPPFKNKFGDIVVFGIENDSNESSSSIGDICMGTLQGNNFMTFGEVVDLSKDPTDPLRYDQNTLNFKKISTIN